MPELKRVPQDGKMNTDFHPRILPPGSYREALNINIGRSETSEVGTVENLLGNANVSNLNLVEGSKVIGFFRDNENERVYFFVTSNNSSDGSNTGTHGIHEYSQVSGITRTLVSTNELNFHQNSTITGVNLVDGLLFWTDNRNEPRKINVERAINQPGYYDTGFDNLAAVARPAPWEAPDIVSVGANDEEGALINSNFLEDKLPRFSYRWKFADGEFSVYAPFSPIVFSRLDNTDSVSTSLSTFGEIPTFVNAVKSARLRVPTPSGYGITSVELLYKETTSSTVYIVDDLPVVQNTFVEFFYASQDPFRALPASQLTRVSDAVPRLAKSQELAGARLIYGNFLQNYDLPQIDFTVSATTDTDAQHTALSNYSVKSRRTYQVGIVLVDAFGRQTPVILSNSGGDTIFVDPQTGASAFQALRISFPTPDQFPSWAHSYRVVVKQREQEYYTWISVTDAPGLVARLGDSINKVPRDTTAQDPGNASISPTAVSVYPKVIGNSNNSTSGLVKVQQIQNPGGTAVLPVANAPGTNTLVVYETEPVSSNLDIFYETSTGGLVSDISTQAINISFFNCYILSVGNFHVELNRLRAGFNEPFLDVGVRAHIVVEDFAGEERRFNALIHSSGLFNSRTGLNQLNQFNEAEGGLVIRLDPSDGSIQKLYAEDTQLIIWQEDKVSRSPIDKDFIFSAEGGAVPVTSSTQFLGTVAPYVGEYGISRNPESFAVYGTRKYFTDKNRGVVLRLSNDGLSEISQLGMADFFRDALRTSTEVIGSFDEYHNTYHLTIVGGGYTGNKDTNRATASDGYFTIAYEEDTKGWPTFKSFKKESGVTLNNAYYTFSGGNIYEHNRSDVNRNTFYGVTEESYIDFIFNDAPSSVKQFMTLGYEGDAGWECEYFQTDITTLGTNPNDNVATLREITLDIQGAADNTAISGSRVIRGLDGDIAEWNVAISPIDPTYRLTSTDQVTLTGAGVGTPTIVDGVIYYPVSHTISQDFTVVVTIGGEGAELIFNISLLQISIDEQITGLQGPATISFDTAGTQTVTRTLTPTTNAFYVEAGDLSADLDGISRFTTEGATATFTQNGNDVDYSFEVTVPETSGNTGTVDITAGSDSSARQKGRIMWAIPTQGSLNRTGSDLDTLVSPYDPESDRTAVLTLTAGSTQIIDESVTVTAPGATVTKSTTVDSPIEDGEVQYEIVTQADTGTTSGAAPSKTIEINFSGDTLIDASFGTYSDLTFNASGNSNQTVTGNSNVPITVTANDSWISLFDSSGTALTSPAQVAAGTDFQVNASDNDSTDITISFASTSIEIDGEDLDDIGSGLWTVSTDSPTFTGYAGLNDLNPSFATLYSTTFNSKTFYLFRVLNSGFGASWVIGPETLGSSSYIIRDLAVGEDQNNYELSTTDRTWTLSSDSSTTVTSTSSMDDREGTITISQGEDITRLTLTDVTINITQNG